MIYVEQGFLSSLKSVYSHGRDRQDYQKMVNNKSYSEISRENMDVSSENMCVALKSGRSNLSSYKIYEFEKKCPKAK